MLKLYRNCKRDYHFFHYAEHTWQEISHNPEWSSLRTHLLIILLKLCEESIGNLESYGDDVENFRRRLMILLLKTAEF
jgi:hypothetical protein